MKKLSYLIVLALILGLILTGCSLLSNVGQVPTNEQGGITYLTKGSETAPDIFTLYAGQSIDVGTVSVWNDEENLYITYSTTGGWEMTETHLAVATSLTDIPQAKGNPIPGKFPYSTIHDSAVTEFTYTIPLEDWDSDTSLFIAAHAKVQLPQLSDPIIASVASGDSLDTVLHIAEDSGNPGYPIGYPGPYAGTPTPAVLTWVHPSWPAITGAQWISSANLTEDPDVNSWRLFTRNIVIPSNAVNITGTITMMTADNAEEVYLNSIFIGSDGEVYGPFHDDQEWNTIETFSGLSLLPDTNTLEVMVRNFAWPGGIYANPTGLIYKMDYEYQLLTYLTETAWAADGEVPGSLPFPGKNWATYFRYEFEEVLIDTVTVSPDGEDHCSLNILETGKNYRLDVSGTYIFAPGWLPSAGIADAKYSLRAVGSFNPGPGPQWISGDDLVGYENYLELLVDGDPQAWGALNLPDHTYSTEYTGDGTSVCFSIIDSAYGDNSGSLSVNIYWVP